VKSIVRSWRTTEKKKGEAFHLGNFKNYRGYLGINRSLTFELKKGQEGRPGNYGLFSYFF
jgi:hypothetical protein